MAGLDRAYLSREGYENLKKELDHLKLVVRKEVSQQIKEAREQGDLSENAEYDAAKEKQARVEKRINELSDKLSRATIIDSEELDASEIRVGCSVKLKDLDRNKEVVYTLVDVSEADFKSGKISVNSPVGQGLLGAKVGENVTIELPVNTLKFKVISISRE